MKRVVLHWTAGPGRATATDRKHYHGIVERDGTFVPGDHPISANESTRDGDYAAHTRGLNTGSIGLAMAGMLGAQERPFDPGTAPLTEVQVAAFCRKVAELCREHGIPIEKRTVLTHAEVEPTLGVKQRGKWDICWLPGMDAPGDPVEVGGELRARIMAAEAPERALDGWNLPEPPVPAPTPQPRPTGLLAWLARQWDKLARW